MTDTKTREERLALLASGGSNKFAAKLTFTERCEILALRHAGVRREVLAEMYNVDRRTITHIYNPMSRHYANVREQETTMGRERFRDTYLSDDLLSEALTYVDEKKVDDNNNPKANGKQGIHVVRGVMCKYDHRVAIKWVESGVSEPGWYYCDLDGDFPDMWFAGSGDGALKTSQACFKAMLEDITDRME